MWTLYDFLGSGNGYKVRLTLRELAQPFTYREVDILQGESRQRWFLEKNPVGQVPLLELEDGTCLCESTAILFHIAEGSALLPDAPLLRTRTLQWMCFEQTHVDGVISRARFRRLYPEAVPTRPEEFDAWWAQGKRALEVLDAQLRCHDYLVGDSFSIADIANYAYVHRAAEGGFDMAPHGALRDWFGRIEARPAYLPIDEVPG
jgi:glutathione S-transferase